MTTTSRPRALRVSERGISIVLALLLVALLGVGLSLAGPAWQAAAQREREQEWLRIGSLYALALGEFVAASPGSVRQPPRTVDELLSDSRFIGVRRHLRSAYPDPLRPGQPWALLVDSDQRILGVYSRSNAEPYMKIPPPQTPIKRIGTMNRYSDWAFVAPLYPAVKIDSPTP